MSTQPDKPLIFDLDKYALFTPVEGNRRAALNFGLREGYPRITVFTSTQSDKDGKGVITVAFDLDHFLIFLTRLERLARTDGVSKEKATVKHFPRDATGKITGNPEPSAELWYGKNDQGIVWLSVVQPNRPKIVFEITISNFHDFHNTKGEPISKAEGSVARAVTMAGVLRYHFTDRCLNFRDTSIPRVKTLPYSQRNKGASNTGTPVPSIDSLDIGSDVPY